MKLGGHTGYSITGPSGNSTFLPAAGFYIGAGLYGCGSDGYFWSATLSEKDSHNAVCLYFRGSSGNEKCSSSRRICGCTIRSVIDKK